MITTKENAANVLRDMASRVEQGDSFEGQISYTFLATGGVQLFGAYRIGNLDGQGGMRVIDTGGQADEC